MAEYRIVKKETKSDAGKVSIRYYVEKKFLWWWMDVVYKSNYHTQNDWNREPRELAFIQRSCRYFNTEAEARQFLEKIQTLIREVYKGNAIEEVFVSGSMATIFLNKSHGGWLTRHSNTYGYEYSTNLDGIKKHIDSRRETTSTSVV